jgi:uncharacterized protein (TIGR00304 family)
MPWVFILRRHDKEVLVLLIFCISGGCWLCLLKTLLFFILVDGGKRLDLAIILASRGRAKKNKIHSAGVIMIGPIPIIFGTDKKSAKVVLVLALGLTLVVLIIIVVYYWLLR